MRAGSGRVVVEASSSSPVSDTSGPAEGLIFPPSGPRPLDVAPLRSKATTALVPMYREKVQAVEELLAVAGISEEEGARETRMKSVFSFFREMKRLERVGYMERPQKMLSARFELGRQFEPDQLRRLEGCSVILAIAFAAYVEQVLVAKTASNLKKAKVQARDFIVEMNRERGLLK